MFFRLLISSALVLICSFTCFADGVVRDGIGAISTGRGGTNLGFADNGQMILENPAAMSSMAGMRLTEFDFDVLLTDLDYSDPDTPLTSASDNPFPMGQVSFVTKVPSSHLALGFGVFPQAGFSSKYELNGPAPFT